MSIFAGAERPIARTDQLVCEDVSGECVIYDASQKTAHHLNSTLTWIWHRCDGKNTLKTLGSDFDREFNVNDGFSIVLTGLGQLDERGLLENTIPINELIAAETSSISRRSMMMGGTVLMPLVVSILVPTSAAAKSKEPKPKPKPKPKTAPRK